MLFLFCILLFSDVHSRELDGCDAVSASLTAPKTGQKAWDKCIEYQERFVYPCEKSSQPGATPQRGEYCTQDPPVLNDTDSSDNEYNYVVSLGYGPEDNKRWFCGGTIISERHILTAAQCAKSNDLGPMNSVYLGAPVQPKDVDQSRLYKIKSIIKHPDYNAPNKYHDIALVETEELMKLNKYIRPACLHTGEPLNYDEATSISRNFGSENTQPKDLKKLKLTKLSKEECSKYFPVRRLLLQGYVDDWQMCYQDKDDAKWTIRFDGGCPLQVKSDKINCMNVVIGVTSFGPSSLTVFTKVVHYLPWIESVVWP